MMPSTSTALRVIVASDLAAALTPPQPGRHALRARPLAAALVETAGLVPDGARHVSEDLVKKTHRFDVSLTEPLGLTLGEAFGGVFTRPRRGDVHLWLGSAVPADAKRAAAVLKNIGKYFTYEEIGKVIDSKRSNPLTHRISVSMCPSNRQNFLNFYPTFFVSSAQKFQTLGGNFDQSKLPKKHQ